MVKREADDIAKSGYPGADRATTSARAVGKKYPDARTNVSTKAGCRMLEQREQMFPMNVPGQWLAERAVD
jgi:hypothetical protein